MKWKGGYYGQTLKTFAESTQIGAAESGMAVFPGTNQGYVLASTSAYVVSEVTIPAGTFKAGDILRFTGLLELSSFTSTDPNTITVDWQGKNAGGSYNTFMGSGAVTPVTEGGGPGHTFRVDVDMHIRSVSATSGAMTQGIAGSMSLIQDTKVRQDVGQCSFHTFTSTKHNLDTTYGLQVTCSHADTPVIVVNYYATLWRP